MSAHTDFVGQQMQGGFNPPVRSLMDIDFYKFTMGQLIFKHFRDVDATFTLINRDKSIPLAMIVPQGELEKYLDYARTLSLSSSSGISTDMALLRGMRVYGANMFFEEYMQFLEKFRLPSYRLRRVGDQYELTFSGSWVEVSMWETIALAIISELFYRKLMESLSRYELDVLYARAKDKVWRKLEILARNPDIRFADFGQRRRHSFLWQQWVLGACKEVLPEQLTGTSNTWMAFHHNMMPIGTNAHELPMALVALASSDEEMWAAQYETPRLWQEMYGPGLRIFLTDTYTSKEFFRGAPEWLAHDWRGMRQDSGDPFRIARLYIKWLQSHGVDPKTKLIIFSDGLDVEPMRKLQGEFGGKIGTSYGWGTLFTNDFIGCYPKNPYFRPFSLVCKLKDIDGIPAVKLSDNIQKATGNESEIARYIKIFNADDRDSIRPDV